jgi:hypothetical protein
LPGLGRRGDRIRLQRTVLAEALGLELKTNLEERPFRYRSVLRPHVDRVPTGVAKGGGQFDSRTEECNCLSSSDHDAMLNQFSDYVQAHLASRSLKFFT